MLTCLKDYFSNYGGPLRFIYKLTFCEGVLSVYNITPKETQSENEVLLTFDLIYTCECTKKEWDDTKSKPLLNVRDAIDAQVIPIFKASDFYDAELAEYGPDFDDDVYTDFYFEKYSHGYYEDYICENERYLIRYVKVDVFQDW